MYDDFYDLDLMFDLFEDFPFGMAFWRSGSKESLIDDNREESMGSRSGPRYNYPRLKWSVIHTSSEVSLKCSFG
jgi:hypothetical protein